MAQRLIVEGNDAIALTKICMQHGLNPPKGYSTAQKFKREFVKSANGIDKIKTILVEELQSPSVTRIGVIVDADDIGAEARFNRLKSIIEDTLNISFPADATTTQQGFGYQVSTNLFIGIWIMPDNKNNGYLEHFISNLIPFDDQTWIFANQKTKELQEKVFCNFTSVKQQKAVLHTYLAWQKNPGLPMGSALQAKYINAKSKSAIHFVEWFKTTFELES